MHPKHPKFKFDLRSKSHLLFRSSTPSQTSKENDESNTKTTSPELALPLEESTSTLNDRLNNITEPYQPTDIVFPQREIGGVKRRFSPAWFKTFPWIHYDTNSDSVFCITCIRAARVNAISSSKKEEAFTTRGFSSWKKACPKMV